MTEFDPCHCQVIEVTLAAICLQWDNVQTLFGKVAMLHILLQHLAIITINPKQ